MPRIVLLAGPNGAGKSTIAPFLLSRSIAYLNADEIAKELTAAGHQETDLLAGRLLLHQWNTLQRQRADFAVETTLATRAFAPRIARMQQQGYRFHLIFLWVPDADYAVERVQERVRHGGHAISEAVIRRRYTAGLRNFFVLYRPLAQVWRMYDNSGISPPVPIAWGRQSVQKAELWNRIQTTWK